MPSDSGSFEQAAGLEVPSISISILSPSTGIPPQLLFPLLPINTTVGDLKKYIQSQVLSKPDLDRLRLIHRGRVLSRDEDTMVDVFGSSALDDPSRKTLHLNLRPLEGEAVARQAFASYIADNQRTRAAAGGSGLQANSSHYASAPSTANDSNTPHAQGTTAQPFSSQNSGLPGGVSGFTRTFAGSNGQQWQTTVNYSSSVTMPNTGHAGASPSTLPQSFAHGTIGGHPMTPNSLGMSTLVAAVEAAQRDAINGILSQGAVNLSHGNEPGETQLPIDPRSLDLGLEQIDVLRNEINVLRGHLRQLLELSPESGNTGSPMRRSGLSHHAETATVALPPPDNSMAEAESQRESPVPTVSAEQRDPSDTVMYLLSSPEGPQALLVSPTGLFSSSNPLTAQGPVGAALQYQAATRHHRMQQQLAELQRRRDLAQPPQEVAMHYQGRPVHNAPPRRNNQPHAGPARQAGWLRLWQQIAPFRDNIWLILRLIGFVFLFTSHSSWQRVILLGLGALTIFLIQTGVLGPVVELVWAPLRRHLEDILMSVDNRRIPHNPNTEGPAPQNTGPQAQQQPDTVGVVAPVARQPEHINRPWFYETIRSLERAIVMFGSSLVPGLWERHIAARAEAERQAELRRIEADAQAQAEAKAEAERAGGETEAERAGGEAVEDV